MHRYLLLIIVFGFIASCRPTEFTPKPAGYFKIDTPATHTYQKFDREDFPYTFEYPVYGNIEKDTMFNVGKADNRFWLNITVPSLGAMINITYLHIASKDDYMKMVNDAYGLSAFHEKKADYMREEAYTNRNGVTGVIYTIGGNVASRMSFTATDSLHHFMRGALYFDVSPNADSLKPAFDFMDRDVTHFLETIRFK